MRSIPGSIGAETYCGPSGAETAASKCAIVSWRESAAGSADSGTSSAHARLSTLRGERPAADASSCLYCSSSFGSISDSDSDSPARVLPSTSDSSVAFSPSLSEGGKGWLSQSISEGGMGGWLPKAESDWLAEDSDAI